MVNSRDKGKRGELECAHFLNEHYPWANARRGQQFHGGVDSADLIWDIEGIHPEVKRVEKFLPYAALEQASEDCGGKVPVVLHRKNDKDWILLLRLRDVGEFVTKWYLSAALLQ